MSHFDYPDINEKELEKLQLFWDQIPKFEHCSKDLQDKFNFYKNGLRLSVAQLQDAAETFKNEIELGLELFKKNLLYSPNSQNCCFKMLDSAIKNLPSGKEQGIYYALDFGGTNFRVVRGTLNEKDGMKIEQYKISLHNNTDMNSMSINGLPKGLLDRKVTATQMFNFFALSCKQLMNLVDDLPTTNEDHSRAAIEKKKACFTFSFPSFSKSLKSAILLEWTKSFETGQGTDDPVEKRDVGLLAQQAFDRHNVPLELNSVISDTIGTLISCAYNNSGTDNPKCLIGLIIGTGMNACYYESKAADYGYVGKIINLECGNYCRNLPFLDVDNELDVENRTNVGKQRLEKMASGAYLGELCRRLLVKLFSSSPFLSQYISMLPAEVKTKHVCRIASETDDSLCYTKNILECNWGLPSEVITRSEYVQIIHKICSFLFVRSTALASVIVAGIYKRLGCIPVTVAIDGSLYKLNPLYKTLMEHHLGVIFGEQAKRQIKLVASNDGSGIGAVILAATIH